jgi:hypothetical protein
MLLSVERPFAGASAFVIPGAALRHRNGLVTAVSPASTEHVRTDNRGSPGTCEILSSPQRVPGRETGSTTPGPDGAPVRRGAKRTSGRGGTAKRRQRSAAGWAAGRHSALIVPSKRGNSPRRTPWREARRQPADPTEGNRPNTSRFVRLSTGLGRIAAGTLRGWRICWLRNRML